jgi:hypothetical protein
MKIACVCGATIRDNTDNLPWKGHLIPDQEWFGVFDAIDRIIDETKSGLLREEASYIHLRNALSNASKPVYQCGNCGRIFIYGREDPAHIYRPESDSTSKEVLRSREGSD